MKYLQSLQKSDLIQSIPHVRRTTRARPVVESRRRGNAFEDPSGPPGEHQDSAEPHRPEPESLLQHFSHRHTSNAKDSTSRRRCSFSSLTGAGVGGWGGAAAHQGRFDLLPLSVSATSHPYVTHQHPLDDGGREHHHHLHHHHHLQLLICTGAVHTCCS